MLKRILLGKEITKTFKVKDAEATLFTNDGVFKITRKGTVDAFLGDIYGADGPTLLENYMVHSKRCILTTDDGTMVPVPKINRIENKQFEREVTITYRKGGCF